MEVLGFLGVIAGAIAAYFAARYVELQGARRRVYARYLAATDGVIGSLSVDSGYRSVLHQDR